MRAAGRLLVEWVISDKPEAGMIGTGIWGMVTTLASTGHGSTCPASVSHPCSYMCSLGPKVTIPEGAGSLRGHCPYGLCP